MSSQDSWGKIPDQPQVAQHRADAQGGFDSWSDGARLAALDSRVDPATTTSTAPSQPAPLGTAPQPAPAPASTGPAPSNGPPSAAPSALPSLPASEPRWLALEDKNTPMGRVTRRTITERWTLPGGEGTLYRTTVQDADAGGAISTSAAQTFVPVPVAGSGVVLGKIATLLDRITVLAEAAEQRDAAREAQEAADVATPTSIKKPRRKG